MLTLKDFTLLWKWSRILSASLHNTGYFAHASIENIIRKHKGHVVVRKVIGMRSELSEPKQPFEALAMNKARVFLTRPDYPEAGVRLLESKFVIDCYPHPKTISRDALLEGIKGKEGLFCQTTERIDKEVVDAAGPQLKVIASMSLGFEHIDIEECQKRGIYVCNGPNDYSLASVAEFTIGLMLGAGRRIIEASQIIRRGEWNQQWSPTWCLGKGLRNSTVGIIGMGRIGLAILRRILPFEVSEVLYYDVYHPIQPAEDLGAKYMSFKELLRNSDFVLATCNLTEGSKGLFNAKAFSLMKSSAIFINTSRGAVVELDDLYGALKTGQIKAAAIDVMYPEPLPKDHQLTTLENIILTPHIAGAEESAVSRLSELAAQNIIAVLEGGKPLTPVY